MTINEASERYNVPLEILHEYERWGLCGAVKRVMGSYICKLHHGRDNRYHHGQGKGKYCQRDGHRQSRYQYLLEGIDKYLCKPFIDHVLHLGFLPVRHMFSQTTCTDFLHIYYI